MNVPALTPRMRDLVRMGALGYSDKQIAAELGLSINTVKVYFHKTRDRIGSFERTMLPGIAVLLGLVSIEEIIQVAQEFLHLRHDDRLDAVRPYHEGSD